MASFAIGLKILFAAILFVGSTGILFSEWGKRHLGLVLLASLVAMTGTAYVVADIYQAFKLEVVREIETQEAEAKAQRAAAAQARREAEERAQRAAAARARQEAEERAQRAAAARAARAIEERPGLAASSHTTNSSACTRSTAWPNSYAVRTGSVVCAASGVALVAMREVSYIDLTVSVTIKGTTMTISEHQSISINGVAVHVQDVGLYGARIKVN